MTDHTETQGSSVDPAEEAVRRYLLFLSDPDQLVDTATVAALQSRLATVKDPIERLKVLAAITVAERVDGEKIRSAFVKVAAGYARTHDLPVGAFVAMGVPRDVLSDAGLLPGGRISGVKRRNRVEASSVVAAALVTEGFFTVGDLAGRTGANPVSVRKVLERLVSDGDVAEFEPDAAYAGRGRAPRRFKVIKSKG